MKRTLVFLLAIFFLSLFTYFFTTKVLQDHSSLGVVPQIGVSTSCALRDRDSEKYSQYYTKMYNDLTKYLNSLGFTEIKDKYEKNGKSIKITINPDMNENISLFKGDYKDLKDFVIIIEHHNEEYSEPCGIKASFYWEKSDWVWVINKERDQVLEFAKVLEKWGSEYPDLDSWANYPEKVPEDLYFYYSDETGGGKRVQTETILNGNEVTVTGIIDGEYKTVEYQITQENLSDIYQRIIEKDLLNYEFMNWSEERNICNCLDCSPQAEHKFEIKIGTEANNVNFINNLDECHIQYNSDENIVREIESLILSYIKVS